MNNKVTCDRSGTISFPLWAKVAAGFLSLFCTAAIPVLGWMVTNQISTSNRLIGIERDVKYAADDRYRASQAKDAHAALAAEIGRNRDDIEELQHIHGRQ